MNQHTQEERTTKSHPRGTRLRLLNEIRMAVGLDESETPYFTKSAMAILAEAMNVPAGEDSHTYFINVPGWVKQRHLHHSPTSVNLVALLDRLTDPNPPVVVKAEAEAEPPVRKPIGRPKGSKAIKPPTVAIPTTAIMCSVLTAIPEQVVVESIAIAQSGKEATIKIVFK